MTSARSLNHMVQPRFGRRTRNAYAAPIRGVRVAPVAVVVDEAPAPSLLDDLKLFASTFAGGFAFMAVYLG